MATKTIMFSDIGPNAKTMGVEEFDEGTVYISNSSPHSLCVARHDKGAVRILDNAGNISIEQLETPARAKKVIGRLVGLVVEKL